MFFYNYSSYVDKYKIFKNVNSLQNNKCLLLLKKKSYNIRE